MILLRNLQKIENFSLCLDMVRRRTTITSNKLSNRSSFQINLPELQWITLGNTLLEKISSWNYNYDKVHPYFSLVARRSFLISRSTSMPIGAFPVWSSKLSWILPSPVFVIDKLSELVLVIARSLSQPLTHKSSISSQVKSLSNFSRSF